MVAAGACGEENARQLMVGQSVSVVWSVLSGSVAQNMYML